MSDKKKPSKEAMAAAGEIQDHTFDRNQEPDEVLAVIIDKYFTPMFMPHDGPMPNCEEMAKYGWSTDAFTAEINRASAAINAAWFKKVKDDGHALGLIPSPLYWMNKYILPLLHQIEPLLTEAQKFNDKLVSENRMLKFEAEQRKLKHE